MTARKLGSASTGARLRPGWDRRDAR